jgi:hypothetical protein
MLTFPSLTSHSIPVSLVHPEQMLITPPILDLDSHQQAQDP